MPFMLPGRPSYKLGNPITLDEGSDTLNTDETEMFSQLAGFSPDHLDMGTSAGGQSVNVGLMKGNIDIMGCGT